MGSFSGLTETEVKMKVIHSNQIVIIPPGLEATVKSRKVTVKGPRGVLRREFKHLAVDIRKEGKNKRVVEKWFGIKRELAAVRTVCSHIENMFKGVTKGYQYKMRSVYAHFPINIAISEGNTLVEVRNSLARNLHEKFVCF